MKRNSKQIKLFLAAALLQNATISHAMVKIQQRHHHHEECLSHHIETHNNNSARTLIRRHSSEALNNEVNFANKRLPLVTAIASGNINIIEDLIAAGANPNACDREGSPLQEAAKQGNIYIMEILKQKGARFDQSTIDFAMNAVDAQKSRLLWPGVSFKDSDRTQEDRIQTVKETITLLAQQKRV